MPRPPRGVTRRDALKALGGLAVAPALAGGCGADARPSPIKTIVVLMMENRSYDHYFGVRSMLEGKPGDGLRPGMSNLDMDGVARAIYRETDLCIASPPHGWTAAHNQFAEGKNDGFMTAYQHSNGANLPPHPMGYFTRADIPVIHALADAYTSCDRWFASVMGPTWPNRLYHYAAQSGGFLGNMAPPEGKFSFPTIFDRLDRAGVDWLYYFSDVPFLSVFTRVPEERLKRIDTRFFDDAAAGALPPVTIVDPAFARNDDHPPHHPLLGEQLIAAVHTALAASPQWNELLFVVLYDEHGGFFDHVPPPKTADERAADGFDQLGFRVPAVVAGPYARRGHLSSVVHDHTSVLRHIEGMFDLEPLTKRDAAAHDLTDALDGDRMARGEPAPPAALPAVEVDESMIDGGCFLPGLKPSDMEVALDSGYLPRHLDGRPAWRDQAHLFGEVLDRAGAGRVRRR